MSPRQAFKYGFLLKCAEEGLSPQETKARIDRARAFVRLQKRRTDETDTTEKLAGLGSALTKLTTVGLMTPMALGVLGGAGTGYVAAKMNSPEVDPDEAKLQELIITYQQQAAHARRAAARHQYRNSAGVASPRLVA